MKFPFQRALACIFLLVATTLTQANANNSPNASQPADLDGILTRTLRLTAIPENEPQAIDMGLMKVPGADRSLTDGVTAKAYTRFVTVEGRKIGQIVLTGVEKNGRVEHLDSAGFTAQFDIQAAPELDPAHPVSISGDPSALIAALERLREEDKKPEEKPEQKVEKDDAKPREPGSNAPSNDQAAGYSNPEPVKVADKKADTMRITTEGCNVRIDMNQMLAIQQSRVETTGGDGSVSTSGCDDGEDRYPLQKSYSVCSDKIDLDAKTATAQFLLFYVDGSAARQEVSECEVDPEQIFPITEKSTGCPIFIDYNSMQAVPQAALVYTNSNNAEVQVRGCQASETVAPAALQPTTMGCSIRHDFVGGKSFQQGTYTYLMDGIQYQAGGCTDNGTEYPHQTVYQDASGSYIYAPVVDKDGGQVTLQSRVKIEVDGTPQFISECKPDTSSYALVATTDGCTDPSTWTHDLAAGQSYGQERFYFSRDSKRDYVTGCQNSTVTYTHQVEITGWQYHDNQLMALPLSTVYIDAPTGRYDIKVSEVLSGATQMPYEKTGTQTVPNGQSEYSGCDALRLTDKAEIWKRPDGTDYPKAIGPGDPIGPVNACTVLQTPRWNFVSKADYALWDRSGGSCSYVSSRSGDTYTRSIGRNMRIVVYRGTRVLQREDGTQITQTSQSTHSVLFPNNYYLTNGICDGRDGYFSGLGYSGGYAGSAPGYSSYPTTYSQPASWDQAEGW